MGDIPPIKPKKCDSLCGATSSQCIKAEGICANEESWWNAHKAYHRDHGSGHPDYGPDDPDCPCRATELQAICAKLGCGFCMATGSRSA